MASTFPSTYLETGSKDTASVKQLQDFLVSGGYLDKTAFGADNSGYGVYGPKTTAAVAALQSKLGVDNSTGVGQFGPRTIAALTTQGLGATPAQSNAIGQAFADKNVNQYGVPNNIGDILGVKSNLPSPNAPIDASKLGTGGNTQSFNDILSAAFNDKNPTSSIAGLLSLYGVSSDQQKEIDKTNAEILSLTKSLGQEDADLQKFLREQGVPAAYDQVKQLNLEAAQLKGELDAFDVETEKLLGDIEDQPITARVAAGTQARLQRQRNLDKMAKASKLSAVIGLSQAYAGNAELGTKLAQQSIDLKYNPIKSAITVLKEQLRIQSDSSEKSDSTRAKIISGLIGLKEASIDKAAAAEKQIQALAIQAATNGAPPAVIAAIQNSPDPVSAASAGSQYIKGNLESVGDTGGGGTKVFSATQKNKGAQVAGLDVAAFDGLEYEVRNYLVNNAGADEVFADINKVANGQLSAEQVKSDLDSSGLPANVVAYLKQRVDAVAPSSGGGGGFLSGVGNFFRSAGSAIGNILGF